MSTRPSLLVEIDGVALPEEEARQFWARFSEYMEAHRGDLAGFAKNEGFSSVHPATRSGRAILIVSRSAPQRAYAAAKERSKSQ